MNLKPGTIYATKLPLGLRTPPQRASEVSYTIRDVEIFPT